MGAFSAKTFKSDDSTILRRIACADKTAARECIELYGKMIWALAKQYTASTEDAERIVPEIFMDIWQSASDFDLKKCDEAVWIALVARRRLSGCFLEEDVQSVPEYAETNFQQSLEIPNGALSNPFDKISKRMAVIQ